MPDQHGYWDSWWKRRASRRRFLGAAGTGAAGLATISLVGCGDDDDDDDGGDTASPTSGGGGASPTAAASASPGGGGGAASALPDHPFYRGLPGGRTGGKYTFSQADDPVGADPHSHEEPGTQSLVQPIYNGLFMPWEAEPAQQEIIGELVDSWEQVSDTEFTMKLREGVMFQDVEPVSGREFTADDVVYNMTRWKDTSRPENRLRGMYDPVDKYEAVDNYTVKLTLSQPFAPLLINLGFTWASIVPREIIENGEVERKPIGTGPFILDSWERGVSAKWSRNPNYWKTGLPYFDEMEMQVLADRAVREAKFLAKELDNGAVNILGSKEETIQADMQNMRDKVGVEEFYEIPGSFLSTLKFYANAAHPPFDDVRIRQAFSHAFPYEDMIANFAAGRGLRTGPMSSANFKWALPEDRMPAFDPAKSKELLTAAGIDTLESEMWVSPQYSGTTLAPIVAGILKQTIGAEIGIKQLENAQWIADVYRAQADYPLNTQADWSFDDPDRTLREYFHTDGSAAHYNANDPELDKMLDDQRKELDEEARIALVQDIQQYILDNAYVIMFFTIGSVLPVAPWMNTMDMRGGNVNSYRIRDIISAKEGGPRS